MAELDKLLEVEQQLPDVPTTDIEFETEDVRLPEVPKQVIHYYLL